MNRKIIITLLISSMLIGNTVPVSAAEIEINGPVVEIEEHEHNLVYVSNEDGTHSISCDVAYEDDTLCEYEDAAACDFEEVEPITQDGVIETDSFVVERKKYRCIYCGYEYEDMVEKEEPIIEDGVLINGICSELPFERENELIDIIVSANGNGLNVIDKFELTVDDLSRLPGTVCFEICDVAYDYPLGIYTFAKDSTEYKYQKVEKRNNVAVVEMNEVSDCVLVADTAEISMDSCTPEQHGTGYKAEEHEQNNSNSIEAEEYVPSDKYETVYNPVDMGALMPPIRDQGGTQTCWAHAMCAMAEFQEYRKGNTSAHFSPGALAYFTYNKRPDYYMAEGDHDVEDGGNTLLQPGHPVHAAEAMLHWAGGLISEDRAPLAYVLDNGCEDDICYQAEERLEYYYDLTAEPSSYEKVKQLVKDYGTVAIEYYDGYDTYFNDIYNSEYNPTKTGYGHMITIIGWDDNFPASRFTYNPGKNGAWLVRNSWGGNGYGHAGYFWLSYYDKSVGGFSFAKCCKNEANKVYQYEIDILNGSKSIAAYSKVANVFRAEADSKLTSISYVGGANTDFLTLNIYVNGDGHNPESGNLLYSKSIPNDKYKYCQIQLDTPLNLKKNEYFSIVFVGDDYTPIIIAESSGNGYTAAAKPNQSFEWNASTRQWEDFGERENVNVGIKAYTIEDSNVSVTDVKLAQTQAQMYTEDTLNLGSGLTVLPQNAPNKKVNWYSTDRTVATVDKNGVVTALKNGTTMISAVSVTSGAMATCKVTVGGENPKEYVNVTLNANGGTFNDGTTGGTCSGVPYSKYKSLLELYPWMSFDVKRDGYRFVGWYTALVDGEQITLESRIPNNDITLYAHWISDSLPFIDVPSGAYYYEPVKWAYANGITTGTSANTFSPKGSCTRGQTVTFLWRAAGSKTPGSVSNPFVDVAAGAYYYNPVLWAYSNNITTGTAPNMFSPNGTVTRGQVVTFLWRAKGSPEVSLQSSFSDVPRNAYYAKAVDWAVANNVTTGTGKNTFSPSDDCVRGQIVTFLYRSYGK